MYEARAKITTVTVKEFTPEGARLSFNLQGEVKGKYNAARVETIDALIRPDGTAEFEGRMVDTTAEGEAILVPMKGSMKPVSPTMLQVQGTESFVTASKKYAWLNSAKARFEATINPQTGEVLAKGFETK